MKKATGAYRRLLGALVMLIAIGIQLSGGMCIHSVGSRPVATADWQGIKGRSLSDVVDGRSVVSRPSSRDRSRPYRCANGHRQSIIYDGVGRKLRVDYCQVPEAFLMAPEAIHPDGDYEVKMRKEYIGPHIVTDGRLSYTSFDGGYFDPEAGTMYYITDWQGNNAAVVSAGGDIVQQTTYYPYGEPTVEPAGQPFLFGGKEREHGGGRNIHDFGARCLTPYGNWSVTDPLYEKFFPISQYSYCGGDPINRVDPDGKFWDTVWDVGNIIYDGTCAIIEHIKGNHEAAKEYWIDAAYDTGAALIPFVPAGASKVTKAAKGLDKASDAKKGLKNADAIKEGKAFEAEELQKAIDRGENVASQVTIVPLNGKGNVKGNRMRTDQLIKNPDGTFTIVETKRTNLTPLSSGQQKAYDHVLNGNGQSMFEIRSDIRKWGLKSGQTIQVRNFERIDKYKLK